MMLVLKSKEELSMRALDLVEMNLRSGMEKTFFRADACVSGADFDMTCYLEKRNPVSVSYFISISVTKMKMLGGGYRCLF